MKLYVVITGSPVVVVFPSLSKNNYASFPLDHAIVFEEQECLTSGEFEYLFKRDGKFYYVPTRDIRVVS